MENSTITVFAPVSYRKWLAPNFASIDAPPGKREDGFKQLPSTAVSDLPADVLDALANAWLADLYAKVNRPVPCFPKAPSDAE